jgi:hypothetical protein
MHPSQRSPEALMPRGLFARTILAAALMALKNRVELAFLADGRRRARRATR